MFNVFESPWAIIIAAFVVQIILWIAAGFMSPKKRWIVWIIPAVIILLAFGIDFSVSTDAEQINGTVSSIVKAGEKEDCPAIEKLLSSDYRDSFHASKEGFVRSCNKWLIEPFIEKTVKRQLSIEKDGLSASAVYTIRVVFDQNSFPAQNYRPLLFSTVQFELKKQEVKWLISRIEVLEIDKQPAKWENLSI